MTDKHSAGWKDSGSIFVEAMISAAIVAMALAGTFRVISDSAQRGRSADARRTALLVARSEMAAVGADIPLRPGERSGQTGAMIWRVQVTPSGADIGDSVAGTLWRVTVSVGPRDGGGDLATLTTLRLGPGVA